jgi:hypothetical protein
MFIEELCESVNKNMLMLNNSLLMQFLYLGDGWPNPFRKFAKMEDKDITHSLRGTTALTGASRR